MQIGLKPDEVLDMSMPRFRACIDGYSDRMFDLHILSVQQGYWAGYFGRAKKPKSLQSLLQSMLKQHSDARKAKKTSGTAPEPDVLAFQEMEEKFKLNKR